MIRNLAKPDSSPLRGALCSASCVFRTCGFTFWLSQSVHPSGALSRVLRAARSSNREASHPPSPSRSANLLIELFGWRVVLSCVEVAVREGLIRNLAKPDSSPLRGALSRVLRAARSSNREASHPPSPSRSANLLIELFGWRVVLSWVEVAVREGFEPSIRCRIHTFQACSFDRSDTSPYSLQLCYFLSALCMLI